MMRSAPSPQARHRAVPELFSAKACAPLMRLSFRLPQTPPKDKRVRIQVHEPHRFASPPMLTQPEYATLVSVDCFAGPSVEKNRRLYHENIDRLEPLGIPPDHVSIHRGPLRRHVGRRLHVPGGRGGRALRPRASCARRPLADPRDGHAPWTTASSWRSGPRGSRPGEHRTAACSRRRAWRGAG